jgi:thiosulfate/3-mercaptopyruvate sulfurtransferase
MVHTKSSKGIAMSKNHHSEVLVNTQWVAKHLNDSNIRLLEVGWDSSEYESGHIPGSVAGWGLADVRRLDDKSQVEAMLSSAGISNEDVVVIYGGLSNLVAAMAFWMLKIYGHAEVRLLDGGRQKWLAENRPLSTEKPTIQPTQYMAQEPNWNLRADKDHVLSVIGEGEHTIVDARSAGMYTDGHIPSAVNVPAMPILDEAENIRGWQPPTTRSDGTFKTVEELQALFSEKGLAPDQNIVTYCVRGGLSTHMWFVLTQLLGYSNVREYDRSWDEWGNLTDAPIEK